MDSVPHIPIINYHKVSTQADVGITSRRPHDFLQDMTLLKKAGYQTITFRDIAENKILPSKPLIITFDDGYQCIYQQALPIMKSFGFKGIVYMPTDFIGKANNWDVQFAGKRFRHLSQNELRELHANGFEIGSHGCSHQSLLSMSAQEAQEELVRSKQQIEDLLGQAVYSISYPFGRFNRELLQKTKTAGYRFGVASIFFLKHRSLNGLAPLALRRMNIYRMDSSQTIEQKVKLQFRSLFVYRDWMFQKGSLATILWQKWFRKP